jgi:catechol 2,3-dioxygenase-like lactoylglutathione lyase family enzyme
VLVIKGVHHAGLTVGDMRRALAFSRDLLGMEVDPRRTVRIRGQMVSHIIGYDNCDLDLVMLIVGPATRIQLEEFKSPVGTAQENRWCDPGASHINLEVDDILALCERLRGAGVSILSHGGARVPSDSASVDAGGWILAVRDPDRHIVKFLQLPKSIESCRHSPPSWCRGSCGFATSWGRSSDPPCVFWDDATLLT